MKTNLLMLAMVAYSFFIITIPRPEPKPQMAIGTIGFDPPPTGLCPYPHGTEDSIPEHITQLMVQDMFGYPELTNTEKDSLLKYFPHNWE